MADDVADFFAPDIPEDFDERRTWLKDYFKGTGLPWVKNYSPQYNEEMLVDGLGHLRFRIKNETHGVQLYPSARHWIIFKANLLILMEQKDEVTPQMMTALRTTYAAYELRRQRLINLKGNLDKLLIKMSPTLSSHDQENPKVVEAQRLAIDAIKRTDDALDFLLECHQMLKPDANERRNIFSEWFNEMGEYFEEPPTEGYHEEEQKLLDRLKQITNDIDQTTLELQDHNDWEDLSTNVAQLIEDPWYNYFCSPDQFQQVLYSYQIFHVIHEHLLQLDKELEKLVIRLAPTLSSLDKNDPKVKTAQTLALNARYRMNLVLSLLRSARLLSELPAQMPEPPGTLQPAPFVPNIDESAQIMSDLLRQWFNRLDVYPNINNNIDQEQMHQGIRQITQFIEYRTDDIQTNPSLQNWNNFVRNVWHIWPPNANVMVAWHMYYNHDPLFDSVRQDYQNIYLSRHDKLVQINRVFVDIATQLAPTLLSHENSEAVHWAQTATLNTIQRLDNVMKVLDRARQIWELNWQNPPGMEQPAPPEEEDDRDQGFFEF